MTENVNYFRLNPRLEKEIKMDSTNEIELSELLLAAFDFAEKYKNIINKIIDYIVNWYLDFT